MKRSFPEPAVPYLLTKMALFMPSLPSLNEIQDGCRYSVTLVAFLLILKASIAHEDRWNYNSRHCALFFLAFNGVKIHQRRFETNSVSTCAVQCMTNCKLKAFFEKKPVANANISYSSWFYVFICPIKIA